MFGTNDPYSEARRLFLCLFIIFVLANIIFFTVDWEEYSKNSANETGVAVFVIDSVSNLLPKDKDTLNLFDGVSHGYLVCSLVKIVGDTERVYLYNVDDRFGMVDKHKYLGTLQTIIEYAHNNHETRIVVNISLGSYSINQEEMSLIKKLVKRKNVIVVSSAGNDSSKKSTYPAIFDGVICVGASKNDMKAYYSNYGNIDIFAPGEYKISRSLFLPSDTGFETDIQEATFSGTSFAAPRISGLIVKMLNFKPSLSNKEVIEIIQRTSDPVMGFKTGRMNKMNALAEVSEKYAFIKKAKNAFCTLLKITGLMAFAFMLFFIFARIWMIFLRELKPQSWINIKIKKINRITTKKRQGRRDIMFIADYLHPEYQNLFDVAKNALLSIGEPAVKHLIIAYHYSGYNKTQIKNIISTIGGEEARIFLGKPVKRFWRY